MNFRVNVGKRKVMVSERKKVEVCDLFKNTLQAEYVSSKGVC